MNELELLKEQWAEQQFEARANGIPTVSFEEWKRIQAARKTFFENWKNASSDAESIAEARVS